MKKHKNSTSGFAALVVVVSLSILLLDISINVAESIFSNQSRLLSIEDRHAAGSSAISCVYWAFARFADDSTFTFVLPRSATFHDSVCTITRVAVNGQNITVMSEAVVHGEKVTESATVSLESLSISSWEET